MSDCDPEQVNDEYRTGAGGVSNPDYETFTGEIHIAGISPGWYFFREVQPAPPYDFDVEPGENPDDVSTPRTDYWFWVPSDEPSPCQVNDNDELISKPSNAANPDWVAEPFDLNCDLITVRVYNRIAAGELQVTKTLLNADGLPLSDTQKTQEFTFEGLFGQDADTTSQYLGAGAYDFWVQCASADLVAEHSGCSVDKPTTLGQFTSSDSFTLRTGEIAHFPNLPIGMSYKFAEAPEAGITQNHTYEEGQVLLNGTPNVPQPPQGTGDPITRAQFTNTQEVTTNVLISKTVTPYCPSSVASSSVIPASEPGSIGTSESEILGQAQDDIGVVPFADMCTITDEQAEQDFRFEVHFTDPSEVLIPGQQPTQLYFKYYITPYVNFDGDSEPESPLFDLAQSDDLSETPPIIANTITLRHGQTAVFVGVSVGLNYTISELPLNTVGGTNWTGFDGTVYLPATLSSSGTTARDPNCPAPPVIPYPDTWACSTINRADFINQIRPPIDPDAPPTYGSIAVTKIVNSNRPIAGMCSVESLTNQADCEAEDPNNIWQEQSFMFDYCLLDEDNPTDTLPEPLGCGQFILKNGETWRVDQIPTGYSYFVQEFDYSTLGYTTSNRRTSGYITGSYNLIEPPDPDADPENDAQDLTAITVINSIEYARIQVTKSVVNAHPADPIPLPAGVTDPNYWDTHPFGFTLSVGGQTISFTLKNGEVKEFDVLVGVPYRVQEADQTSIGFSTTYQNESGTFSVGTPAVCPPPPAIVVGCPLSLTTVTNTYDRAVERDIPITKLWDTTTASTEGLPIPTIPSSVTFELYDDYGTTYPTTGPLACISACVDRRVASITLTSAQLAATSTDPNNPIWTSWFKNLPKYDLVDDHLITYTVRESKIGLDIVQPCNAGLGTADPCAPVNDYSTADGYSAPWSAHTIGKFDDPDGIKIANIYELQPCIYYPELLENDANCLKPLDDCKYDNSIKEDDPLCLPPCPFNPNILNNDPKCVPPAKPCQYNPNISADDPACRAPTTPCRFNPAIHSDDPACVEPTPTITIPGTDIQIPLAATGVGILALLGFAVLMIYLGASARKRRTKSFSHET
ncbi:hypothetical protein FACS1894125_3040 [Actinomycetota bacterium]|nr:hypothetical protein FACS1894125_3040 [Actinomycetota bacterium]